MNIMETILKIRDICKAHTKCFDGCPLYADGECLVCIPPANLSDEQLYLIGKSVEQESRWIPVSERLPEANIYDGHGPVWKHEVLITGYLSYDDKKETFVNMAFAEDVRNKCVPNTNVTAWMPLPKPYEPQKSEDKEFHCGIEESGFHAYNCNDCPNKCEEYYQWDKEIKKDGNDN